LPKKTTFTINEKNFNEKPQFYEYDFKSLAITLGLNNFNKETQEILFGTAKDFFFSYKIHNEVKLNLAEMERFLKVFRKEALSFIKLIHEIDPLTDYFAMSLEFHDKPYLKIIKRLKADIRALRRASKEIIDHNSLKSTGRPSSRLPIYWSVPELALVYESITNKKAGITWNDVNRVYTSPFYDFVYSFISMLLTARGKYLNKSNKEIEINIEDFVFSNESFGKAIQRALASNRQESQ